MTKHPVFEWAACWSCGEPVMKNGPFTVGCPGCYPGMLHCEKASDVDTQELLHPELREYRRMDEALIDIEISFSVIDCLSEVIRAEDMRR